MKRKPIFITLLMYALLQCISGCTSSPRTEETPLIRVNVDFKSTTDSASLFFDRYDYAVLQPNDIRPVGNIDLIDLDQNRILVVSSETVHVFDRTGKQLSCFNKKGNGPEEYISIQDISLSDDCIYLLSWPQRKIFKYDFEGKCLDSFELPYAYAAIQCSGDGIWLASESDNESKFEFSYFDTAKKKITGNVLPFETNQSTYSSIGIFNPFVFTSNEETLAVKQYDYTVYKIEEDGVSRAWEYSFNTEKQLSDFGENRSHVELYQETGNQPVVMWPGVLWKGNENVYQTFALFYIMGRFTNIYKFSPEHPDKEGLLLHVGLKSYADFPFLRTQVLSIRDGFYVSAMPLSEVIAVAEANHMEFDTRGITDDTAPVIFFHHFKE